MKVIQRRAATSYIPLQRKVETVKLILKSNKLMHRFIFWLINKLDIKFEYEENYSKKVIKYTEINDEKLFNSLRLCQDDLRRIFDKEAKYLIIGRDKLEDLLEETQEDYVQFQINVKLGFNKEYRMLGLKVIVVPWVEGMCLLPDLCSK